jgi:hypothetical protein
MSPTIHHKTNENENTIEKANLVIPFQDSKLFHNFSKSKSKIDDFLTSSSSSPFIIFKTFDSLVSLLISSENLDPIVISRAKSEWALSYSRVSSCLLNSYFRFFSIRFLSGLLFHSTSKASIALTNSDFSSRIVITLVNEFLILFKCNLLTKLLADT